MRLGDLPHAFADWTHDVDPWYGRGVEWALWTRFDRWAHVLAGGSWIKVKMRHWR